MDEEVSISRMLQRLQEEHGILCTKDARKDFQKLVQTDVNDFCQVFYKDFIRKDFDDYNRFEKLSIYNPKQKRRLKGQILRRYEYRNTSNLRCIFIVYQENNNDIPIILCAFNEDGNKKKGKGSYNSNIERAISIFERVVIGG